MTPLVRHSDAGAGARSWPEPTVIAKQIVVTRLDACGHSGRCNSRLLLVIRAEGRLVDGARVSLHSARLVRVLLSLASMHHLRLAHVHANGCTDAGRSLT